MNVMFASSTTDRRQMELVHPDLRVGVLPDRVLLRADEGGVKVLDDENRRDTAVGPVVAPMPVAVGLPAHLTRRGVVGEELELDDPRAEEGVERVVIVWEMLLEATAITNSAASEP